VSYIVAAQKRFPNRRVIGDGRFAVSAKDGGVVYLAVTTQQQHNIALGIEGARKFDLGLDRVLDAIPDRYDADERRRARRERAEQAC
jgi:hypothetical protein